MRSAIRVMQLGVVASAVLAASVATAAPTQLLLSENFQGVTGLTSAATIRTLANITTTTPGQISGSPVATFSNSGNGNASATSFNVRRDDNNIDGTSGTPTFANTSFDNFFLPVQTAPTTIRNRFLVIGDDAATLADSPNGGSSTGASSTMSVRFALAPSQWTVSDLLGVNIAFDYVFDSNNAANVDDFLVDLVLADNSVVNLLNLAAPSATTRGAFSASVGSVAALPAYLQFRLFELEDFGTSAVGIDNIRVSAVPEPGALALVGLALVGLGLTRRRAG